MDLRFVAIINFRGVTITTTVSFMPPTRWQLLYKLSKNLTKGFCEFLHTDSRTPLGKGSDEGCFTLFTPG